MNRKSSFQLTLRAAMMLAVVLMTTATAWAGSERLFYSGGSGDIDDPYQIKTAEDLVTLATNVNSGTTYEGVYFKVMNNINFSEASTTSLRPTTAWNAAASTESNFTPIGSRSGSTIHKFHGHFDGNDCTISGIRIYNAGASANNGGHQGLFGYLGSGAEVKAVTLSNARITGHSYTGGIVGYNSGTVTDCHVTNTVAIHTAKDNVDYHGGIIGFNYSGTVKECTSAATLTFASTNYTGCEGYGGIVGFNNGTLTDNIANGATVPAASNENKHGAIAGDGYTTAMQRNYYLNCNVAGTANATGVGMKGADATANNAAVSIHTLTLTGGVTTTTAPSVTISGTDYYAQGTALVLNNGQTTIPTGYIYSYTVNGESVTTTDNTVAMPAADATIGLGALTAIPWTGSGTSDDPYIILYPSQLDLLATNVNNDDGHFYYNTYFKLGDDIAYDYDTSWDDATSYASNFTPIGTNNTYFRGHFDGNGKTISGIRVYAPTTNDIAIFRTIDSQAEVKGITLDDTRLTGQNVVAGIVARTGTNNGTGTVTGCTVTNRVAIHITATNGSNYGGIVAVNNHGTVSHCVSSIQMTIADGVTPRYCGGIVGNNSDALTDNFVIGALIPETRNSAHAAIAVNAYNTNSYSYACNYYRNCSVAGTANAIGVGVCTMVNETTTTIADITENNGAVPVYLLTLGDGISATPVAITYGGTDYYAPGSTLTLSGGPLDPDGAPKGFVPGYTANGVLITPADPYVYTMPATDDVTIAATSDYVPIPDWETVSTGDSDDPYLIYCKEQLDLLAQRVNDGNKYKNKYFKLAADITYPHTTAWNDATSEENNYTAIGTGDNPFYGHFLGDGHAVSGIRICQEDNDHQGLFGYIFLAEVSGVTLTDARITGKSTVGSIVGNNGDSSVNDCHATATVAIHAAVDEASYHGGIVGFNSRSTVSRCTSAATLTIASGASNCNFYGGIVGTNSGSSSTLSHNLAIGATVPATLFSGAIAGTKPETFYHNYYIDCTVGDATTNIGCSVRYKLSDITENDGAVPAIGLYDNGTANATTISDNSGQTRNVALVGRTLYKDGDWNTLCLPFGVSSIDNSPLAGATVMELNIGDKWKMEDGQWIIDNENGTCQTGLDGTTLYLYFKPASSIVAGRPYIVKWETDTEGTKGTEDTEINNPVFQNVSINSTEHWDTFSGDGKVQFKGIYDRTLLSNDDGSNLCLGDENQLYWPSADETLNAFRAYLHVDGTAQAIQSNLAFGLMGDVNGNGQIDIGDAVCIVNYLVNKTNTVFKDKLADLNGNGGIDIGDAVMIVNILVGKTNSQTTGKGLQTTGNNDPQ